MVFGGKKKKKTEEEELELQLQAIEERMKKIKSKRNKEPILQELEKKSGPLNIPSLAVSRTEEEEQEVPDIEPAYIDPEEIVEEEIVEEEIVEPTKVISKSKARIISSEILDSGLMKFTFISNIKMGDIGQEFDL